MPTHIVIGVESGALAEVSKAFSGASGVQGEGHDSSYLGEYDLFQLPEKIKIKHNHVAPFGSESDPDDEWDYPEAKQFGILIVVEATDRPEFFEGLAGKLGLSYSVIKSEAW